MLIHEIDGVKFEWSPSVDDGDCSHWAKVTLKDACHTVDAELRIRSIEEAEKVRWEWHLNILDGPNVQPGRSDRFDTNVKEFIEIAMQQSARKVTEELMRRQAATRELLAKQQRQRQRASLVQAALEELRPS